MVWGTLISKAFVVRIEKKEQADESRRKGLLLFPAKQLN
jgi:hypothetical protein